MVAMPLSRRKPSTSRHLDVFELPATDMRGPVIVAILLSTVMTNGFETKYRQQAPSKLLEKHYWPATVGDRIPWDNIRSGSNNFSPYTPDRRTRQNTADPLSDDFHRLSTIEIVRGSETSPGRTSSDELSSIESRAYRSTANPKLRLSFDLGESNYPRDCTRAECNSEKCSQQTENWEIQKPIYVEEPRWVEVELDYVDNVPRRLNMMDTFFLSRGKKFFRLKKNRSEKISKEEEDKDDEITSYDRSSDYRYSSDKWRNGRLGRSIGDQAGDESAGQEEESEETEDKKGRAKKMEDNKDGKNGKIAHRMDALAHRLKFIEDPFFLTRGKRTSMYDVLRDFNYDFFDRVEAISKVGGRSLEKRSIESPDKNFDDLDAIQINHGVSSRKKLVSTTGTFSSGMISREEEKSKGTDVTLPKHRDKRYACKDARCSTQSTIGADKMAIDEDSWTSKIRRAADNVERRRKFSDIFDILEEPYFISRGKKKGQIDRADLLTASLSKERGSSISPIGKSATMLSLAAKSVFDGSSSSKTRGRSCVFQNCLKIGINAASGRIIDKRKDSANRRDALSDFLAKYDPYFVARGKRSNDQ